MRSPRLVAWADAAFVGESRAQLQLSYALEDADPLAARLWFSLAAQDQALELEVASNPVHIPDTATEGL